MSISDVSRGGIFLLALLLPSLSVASLPLGVVELTLPVVDKQGKLMLRKGRGVMIGPRTVVTAAHVVGSLYCTEKGGFEQRIKWDKARVRDLRSGRSVGVRPRQVHYHSTVPLLVDSGQRAIRRADLDAYLIGEKRFYDVAVIGLASPLPVSRVPLVARTYPGIFEKLKVVLGFPLPRMMETTVTGSDRYAVHTRVALDGVLRDSVTAQGDSGGPLFDVGEKAGRPVVYGIASTLTTAENGAWKSSLFSRLDLIRTWVLNKRACIEEKRACASATL